MTVQTDVQLTQNTTQPSADMPPTQGAPTPANTTQQAAPQAAPPPDMLSQIRQQEKAKLENTIAQSQRDAAEAKTKAAQLEAQLKELQAKNAQAPQAEEKKPSDAGLSQEIAERLKAQAEQIEALKKQQEAILDTATRQILAADVNAYKERRLREAGLAELHTFVSGNTREEIDASVKLAQETERKIAEKALNAERERNKADAPRPANPAGGGPPPTLLNGKSPRDLASLPHDEYMKKRAELLANARKDVGGYP